MHEDACRQARQDAVEQDVDVAARHQDVARIDEQHVAGPEPVEHIGGCCLQGRGHDAYAGQAHDIGARHRIDGEDLADAAFRPRQDAGRMARPDLDDALRLALAHQGVGHGGIERGEPGLSEQALQAFDPTGSVIAGMGIDGVEHGSERRGMPFEQLFDRGVGRLRARRWQQRRVAVRDEPAARREAQHGRQPQRQPPPASAQAEWSGHGASVSPSWATIARGRPPGTVPGRAMAASRATPSMKASSWLGS